MAALAGNSHDRRRHRIQGVTGGRSGPGQLTEHRGQGVEHRRVVEGPVGLDVAELAHVGRGRLAGVEDPAHGVGVPDGVPGARDGLPVHQAATGRKADQQSAQQHTRRHDGRRPAAHRAGFGVPVAVAGEPYLQTRHQSHTTTNAASAVHAFQGIPTAP